MIIYVKQSEIETIIDKLESIEEKFWLNFRNYRKEDREALEEHFNDVYKLIYRLNGKDGLQEEMELKYEERTD